MADRKTKKISFDPGWQEWIKWVFDKKSCNAYTLGKPETDIKWSERAIRSAINEGKMSEGLLQDIAEEINVDPDYLRGKYLWTLRLPIMEDAEIKEYWKENFLHPDMYPNTCSEQHKPGAYKVLRDTLTIHHVKDEEYLALSKDERLKLELKLDRVITETLRQWFPECRRAELDGFYQSMEWKTEADVYDALCDHLIERGIWPEPEWDDKDDSSDPLEEKYKDIPLVNP